MLEALGRFNPYFSRLFHYNASACNRKRKVLSCFRPSPDGSAFAPRLALVPGYCVLSMLFSDWSRSGHADLWVSNDRHCYGLKGQEQLWRMQPVQDSFQPGGAR